MANTQQEEMEPSHQDIAEVEHKMEIVNNATNPEQGLGRSTGAPRTRERRFRKLTRMGTQTKFYSVAHSVLDLVSLVPTSMSRTRR
jgi:hypothetical protein